MSFIDTLGQNSIQPQPQSGGSFVDNLGSSNQSGTLPKPQNLLQKAGSGLMDYSNNILNQTAQPLTNAMTKVNADNSKQGNFMSKGLDIAGDIAGGVTGAFGGAINAGAIQPLGKIFGNIPGVNKIANSKYSVVSATLDQLDHATKSAVETWNHFEEKNPAVAQKLADAGNIAQFMTLFAGDNPKVQETATKVVNDSVQTAKNVGNKTLDATGKVVDSTGKAATAVKEKIAPSEPVDTTVGKVLQGKTKDVQSGKTGLSYLDTEKIKTYKDLTKASTDKIGELSKEQDVKLSQDKTQRPMAAFEKTTGQGEGAVKMNYVDQAIKNLQELYTSTSDAEGMSKIKELETKANAGGLTTQEVNQLARDYGSEFGAKAFGKTGEPLTSVNAQKFENIRSGLKDSARDLLPDEHSKMLDKQMTDLYTVRDLSRNMSERVNTLTQRLQKVNIMQKLGGFIGKGLRITGVGDLASKLLGIDKVPGAKTLNAVELEAQLSKNLAKINRALTKSDAGFADTVREMVSDYSKDPEMGLSAKDITKVHPEDLAELRDFTDFVDGGYKPKNTQVVTDARRIAIKQGWITEAEARTISDKALSSKITKLGIFKKK